MTSNNTEILKQSLETIEPPMEKLTVLSTCEWCGEEIVEQYKYLKTDWNEYFCDTSCFLSHAFKNYLKEY